MAFSIYTIADAAKDLGIQKETLRHRIKVAKLKTHKLGKLDLITGDDLDLLKQMGAPKKGRHPKKRKQNLRNHQ